MKEWTRGEFARRSGLTVKALRLYERSGLLVPHRVGARNGYRFYRPDQVERAVRIRLLRQMDMPLALIGEVLGLEEGAARERVGAWWAGREETLRAHRRVLEELGRRWDGGVEEEVLWRVRERWWDPVRALAVRARTDQAGLVATFHERAARLREVLTGQGACPESGMWVFYPTVVGVETVGEIEVAVPFSGVADPVGDTVVRVVGGGRWAVCAVARRDCFHPRIMGAHRAVAAVAGRASGVGCEVYTGVWGDAEDEVAAWVARPLVEG
ncbi:MerR family transcriptional regulator [Nocardiopsis sp. N85]|uniref:MerR family transcriptional regulator n=1 Tax=Nocardiopsis sp. N85 TaxID=3029400 RepID=UPI00237EFF42|nr:MerR family transcriptional regulator [Nocardiopsis sp. N85]MDE3722802.1 MerR family transcriptional regulator [Nocardiopsis sp. N85]